MTRSSSGLPTTKSSPTERSPSSDGRTKHFCLCSLSRELKTRRIFEFSSFVFFNSIEDLFFGAMNRSNEENKRFSVRLLVELIRAVKEKRDEPRHSRIPAQFVEEIFAGDVWSTEILGRAGFERVCLRWTAWHKPINCSLLWPKVDDEFRFNGQKTDDELSDLIDFLVQIDEVRDRQRILLRITIVLRVSTSNAKKRLSTNSRESARWVLCLRLAGSRNSSSSD